jgi:hypothetical protein
MRRGLGLPASAALRLRIWMPPTRRLLRRAGAGRRRADVQTDERRRLEVDDLPAVDVVVKPDLTNVGGAGDR